LKEIDMNAMPLNTAAAGVAIALTIGMVSLARAAADAVPDGSTFARGASAWANNCVRCHNARDPKDFRDDQWKIIMSHMRIRAGLTGQETRDVLGFLQQGNNRAPTAVSRAPGPAIVVAAGGMSGKALFDSTCVACHGADGKGTIPGVPDITAAGGPLAQPDGVLRMHVLNGFQTPGSAMAMPPKGGNPSLSEADVAKLVDYMKSTFKP